VLLPLLVAAGADLVRAGGDRRRAIGGLAAAGAVALGAFVVANPHALLSFGEFWDDVQRQESAASDLGKLGLTYDSGIRYYLWTLGWGVGWVPAIAAGVGALLAFRDDLRRALFLVPWPIVFIVYMGLQDRYFGRWLMPALPAIALLAAFAVVKVADIVSTGPRLRTALVTAAGVALVAQGLVYSVHLDRVLSRDDTRNLARAWMVQNVPAGEKVVLEPIVPDAWTTDAGKATPVTPSGRRWTKWITSRTMLDESGRRRRGGVGRKITVEDYERTTRPELIDAYARGGYCWVMIGSTQYGRALRQPEEVPKAIPYYRALARRGELAFEATPYKNGEGPVPFNFDWSFDYYPMAYERPGPTVRVYRIREARCKNA
jgi:hypothetical protein